MCKAFFLTMVVLRFRSLFRYRHRLLVRLWIHGKFLLVADPRHHFIFSDFWLWSTQVLETPVLDSGVDGWQFSGSWTRLESIEMYHQRAVALIISAIWGYYLDPVCYNWEKFHHPIRPPPWPVKFGCFPPGECWWIPNWISYFVSLTNSLPVIVLLLCWCKWCQTTW